MFLLLLIKQLPRTHLIVFEAINKSFIIFIGFHMCVLAQSLDGKSMIQTLDTQNFPDFSKLGFGD